MANKDKIIKQAGKYIAKGQLDRAIKELQKAVALDPGDVRTLLKLGDVYSKKEDRDNATEIYRQVADSYSEQGFFLKAVAVHKQILKHDTDNLEVRLKLAELYEQLGLASEAQTQYQEVARIHDAKGDTQGSLQVLERLVELDSENVASRIKLAEGYSRAGQVEAAVKAFAKAAEVLKRQGRIDDYVKVAERLVYHDPDRFEVVKDLARVYLSRGDTKRGLAKLQLCFKSQPRDIETLTLLSQAFSELGQTQKTIFVYKELAAVHNEQGRLLEAQQMFQRILELDPSDADANQALGITSTPVAPMSHGVAPPQSAPHSMSAPISGPRTTPPPVPGSAPRMRLASDLSTPDPTFAPVTGGAQPPAPSLSPPPAPNFAPPPGPHSGVSQPSLQPPGPHSGASQPSLQPPPPPPPSGAYVPATHDLPTPSFAPRPPAPAATPDIPIEAPVPAAPPPAPVSAAALDDTERRIQDIITETDVFVRYGLAEKALDHLRRVFELDPDNVLAFEKMRDIHLNAHDTARAAEAVANIMHAHARSGDDAALDAAREELARLAPGHPLAHGGLPGAIPPAAPPPREEDELSIDITEDSGVIELGEIDAARAAAPVYDYDQPPVVDAPLSAEAEGAFDFVALPGEPTDANPRPMSSPFVTDPSFDAIEPLDESTDLPPGPDMLDAPADEMHMVFEDEEATIAAPGLAELDPSAEEHTATGQGPRFDPPGEDPFAENMVTGGYPQANQEAPSPFDEAEEGTDAQAPLHAEPEAEIDVEGELEEVAFYLDNGLLDEARDALEAVLGQAPEDPAVQAMLRRLEDEGAEHAEVGAEEDAEASAPDEAGFTAEGEETPDEQTADPTAETEALTVERAPTGFSDDVDAAFASFEDPDPQPAEDDPENQYDLGMVMMETMQYDAAIEAFRSASRAESRALSALEMIGNCYRQKGQPLEAIDYYVDALDRGAEGPAAINLTYEIGAAYEEAGELQHALEWMERCAASDRFHRDVEIRIGTIASQLGAPKPNGQSPLPGEPRGPTSSKKNKISYL